MYKQSAGLITFYTVVSEVQIDIKFINIDEIFIF